MEIVETKNFIEAKGVDEEGKFTFRLVHTGFTTQMQLETDYGEAFANLTTKELKMIADIILKVIEIKSMPCGSPTSLKQ